MKHRTLLTSLLTAALLAEQAAACSLCGANLQRRRTLREDAALAKIVVYGELNNPRLVGDPGRLSTGGKTDLVFQPSGVLKSDPFIKGRSKIVIPRYMSGDKPFVIFCDVFRDQLDPYRGVPVNSPKFVAYIKGLIPLDPNNATARLLYAYKHLDSADADVARDAFLEFAKAQDADVAAVAPKLDPEKLRRLVATAPAERLGVLAYLMGACGGDDEAKVLARLLADRTERAKKGFSGLLGGFIELRPEAGWRLARAALTDPARAFPERLAVLTAVRFLQKSPDKSMRPEIIKTLASVVANGELADLAVEDLRRWGWWDLTGSILSKYGAKTHDAPLVRRAILRYALSCPEPPAKAFIAKAEAAEPKLVAELRDSLKFEAGGR